MTLKPDSAWLTVDRFQRQPGWFRFEDRRPAPTLEVQDIVVGQGDDAVHWRIDSGMRRQVFLLNRPARGMSVRTQGEETADSGLEGLRLVPLGRLRALGCMLIDGAGAREVGARVWTLVVGSLTYGLRAAVTDLHVRHRGQAGVVESERHARWTLRRRWWLPTSSRLLLHPGHQLVADGVGGWRSTGRDPCFMVSREGGGAPILAGGWYVLRGRMTTAPRVHLALSLWYRTGRSGQPVPQQLPLPLPGKDGLFESVLLFDDDVTELRFDPAVRPLGFHMDGVRLRRLSRVEWMLRLLFGLRRPSGGRDWRAIRFATRAMVSALRDGGMRAAGAVLAERSRESSHLHSRSYAAWVMRYDTFSGEDLAMLAERGRDLAVDGPLVSVLLPVYNTPQHWLRRCLDSVLAQAYPNWELCIADDASTQPHVRSVLQEYARRDPRIRVEWREHNGHIAQASNTALAMVRGQYIALLDHDDELRPHALLEMVDVIREHPDTRFLYSDEDKIDEHGRRFQPYFKPDWNPDLLLSQNYLCHLTVVETALARGSGGFREGTEGSQDHDLFLRCTNGLAPAAIRHIPKVLYHWRAIEGSTALERSAKDYAAEAGLRAVDGSVRALVPDARAEHLEHGHYRVRWPLPSPQPKVSIIIPTRDRVDLLRHCVESVLGRTDYNNFELVVVDNGSRDPEAVAYLDSLRSRDRVRVLQHDVPFNFSQINNWAVSQCDGELLCLLNNDIEVIDGEWLGEMASQALRHGVGAVGAMLLYPDDRIQHAGVILGSGGVASHAYCHQPIGVPGHGARALVAQNLSAVTAACLVVRRQTYLDSGGLDEELRVAFNDIDFCLRLQAMGYRNVWTPFARLYHHESASRGTEDTPGKLERFRGEVALMRGRWASVLDNDPAHNPNLSLETEDIAGCLAFPPREADRATFVSSGLPAIPAGALVRVRGAVAQARARRRSRPTPEDGGSDVIIFWKQNDSTLYGRRNDMVARYLANRADVRRVIVVDAPISEQRLAAFAAGNGIDQSRWIHDRTLEKLRGECDTDTILHKVFVYDEHFGQVAHEDAHPRFVEVYGTWLARELEREDVEPANATFWIYPRDFCMPTLLERFRPRRVVVDMVDDDRAWPGVDEERKQRLGGNYAELLRSADLVLANCASVRAGLQHYRDDVHVVPNGVDESHGRLRGPGRPPASGAVIGYVGNLEAKIDVALLDHIANHFPQHRLVLVGSAHANPAVRELLGHPNVEMPGVVPYDLLGDWLSCFDVAVIPHLDMAMTRHMNPLKTHVYLAWGIPVVSTAVANVGADGELVRVADDHQAFVRQLEQVLELPRAPEERFRTYIADNSWRARLDGVVDALRLGSAG